MSDTPLTDAAVKELLQTSQHERVKAEFARQLEREIVKLKVDRSALASAVYAAGRREVELTRQLTPAQAS